MIVCQCNVLTHDQVLATLKDEPAHAPRSPVEAYRCLGCSPDCGRCIPTVRELLRAARAAASAAMSGCQIGCPACPNEQAHPPRDAAGIQMTEVNLAAGYATMPDHVVIEPVDERFSSNPHARAAAE